MSNTLNASHTTIEELFKSLNTFVIPEYQRAYSWGIDSSDENGECIQLWNDIKTYHENRMAKDESEQDIYFLGAMVFSQQQQNKHEYIVIDGQQRITSMLLLLKAFLNSIEINPIVKVESTEVGYDKLILTRNILQKCIYKGKDKKFCRLSSESTFNRELDNNSIDDIFKEHKSLLDFSGDKSLLNKSIILDRSIYKTIWETINNKRSNKKPNLTQYHINYCYFEYKIREFIYEIVNNCETYTTKEEQLEAIKQLSETITDYCEIIEITEHDEGKALDIFTILNSKGKSLEDEDIFKSYHYKHTGCSKKEFFEIWKNLIPNDNLEEDSDYDDYKNKNIKNKEKNSKTLKDLYTQYMHYLRANNGDRAQKGSLRKFYSRKDYEILNDKTLDVIADLSNFWIDINKYNKERFSFEVLKQINILKAVNVIAQWDKFVAFYYLSYLKDNEKDKKLFNEIFEKFLKKTIWFIWIYQLKESGSHNSAENKLFNEMVTFCENKEYDFFSNHTFDSKDEIRKLITDNASKDKIIRPFLLWWHHTYLDADLVEDDFEIEHIYPKSPKEADEKRLHKDKVVDVVNRERIGNKSIVESLVNKDKAVSNRIKKNYTRAGTKIPELIELSKNRTDEKDFQLSSDILPTIDLKGIEEREKKMISEFISYIEEIGLVSDKNN